jgi:hypothetical protein
MRSYLALLLICGHLFLLNHSVQSGATAVSTWITKVQSDCELEALNIGSRLSDRYNSFDEATEWDIRIHHDYLTKYLGFAGWIQMGLWKNTQLTALKQNAPVIHKVRL